MRRSKQRRDAVFACYQHDVTDRPLGELVVDAGPFTRDLAEGVDAHRAELDERIERYLQGWTMDRLSPLDHNIMRVALYEMAYRPDVPAEVAINEAVECAKRFSGVDSPGFVNGILGAALGNGGASGEAAAASGERDTPSGERVDA